MGSGVGQPVALVSRIQEKMAELDNLKQLRDLSASVASHMEKLEEKLSTLSDGTEAIAAVLGNWNNVLQAINMASMALARSQDSRDQVPLPETLVRIPTEDAPTFQAHAEAAEQQDDQKKETT